VKEQERDRNDARPGSYDLVERSVPAEAPRAQKVSTRDGAGSDRLLTAKDLAEHLALPRSWIYAEARAGRLSHIRLGRYRRFRLQEIERWLCERSHGPA
jgi:excisionase family DNA binding protein